MPLFFVMDYNKPYLSIIQEHIDSLPGETIAKLRLDTLKKFDEDIQVFITNTSAVFLMDLITLKTGDKNIKDILTREVFEKCVKKREETKKLFTDSELEDVFAVYSYQFMLHCKNDPQDVFNVFGIKA